MFEWHLSPDYIVNNWTDELLDLMMEQLAARKEREVSSTPYRGAGYVSDSLLFAQGKNMIKWDKN